MDALEAFECEPKTEQKPAPFDHLAWPGKNGTFDVDLEVELIRKRRQSVCDSN